MNRKTSEDYYEEGKTNHKSEGHEGSFDECERWACLAYKSRSRYVAKRDEEQENGNESEVS